MEVPVAEPQSILGTWRRFGPTGPVYEIVEQRGSGPNPLMRIRVVESGEELDYPLAHILEDPQEA
jgi:hypothetical protein